MSWKKILALALLLALLIAAIALVDRRGSGKPASEGTLLDMPAASVERIELRNPDGRFVFSRRDAAWVMEEPRAARADRVALESILDNFCSLKYDRLVAEHAGDLKSFGLDSPAIELKLIAKGGARPEHTVLLGVKNSMDDSSYAKLAAGDRVVSIAAYRRHDLEKGLFAFRDKKLLEIDATAVSALEFHAGGNALAFARKNGRWFMSKPVDSLAQDARVGDLLTAASTLEALSFAPAADRDSRRGFGVETPILAAEFRSPAGVQRIQVGKKGERFYAWVEGATEIGEIGKEFSEKFSADAAYFRERKVARFYAFDVRELAFQRGPFAFSLRKDEAGEWVFAKPVAGKKASTEKIDRLLTALADCEASEFIDGAAALPSPLIRAALKAEDPATPGKLEAVTMEFFAGDGKTVIARNPALAYAFRVDREILAKLPAKIEDVSEESAGPIEAGK